MRRFPVLLASSILSAFLSVGCKQDLGERCEQNSDCSSGYCNGSGNRTSAEGGKCTPGPVVQLPDAATPFDANRPDLSTSEAGRDASDASDGAPDVSLDVSSDVSRDTGTDTTPADVGTDPDSSTGG